jgi:hypothetical protein
VGDSLTIRKDIGNVISTDDFYFVRNVPLEEVIEIEIAALDQGEEGILHHETNCDEEFD